MIKIAPLDSMIAVDEAIEYAPFIIVGAVILVAVVIIVVKTILKKRKTKSETEDK